MSIHVKIVRKDMVKPSSPTPHHLKEHKLSFLDQMAPPIYIPLIFFYEAADQIHRQKDLLKSYLSIALTRYYPLAGRVIENYCIDCNDAGALFVEATVNVDLLMVTVNPDMDFMKQLLPLDFNSIGIGEDVLLAVQFNLMGCGGTAIAVQMSHKLADGHSLVTFMNSWAEICREEWACSSSISCLSPSFDVPSLFPPVDFSSFCSSATTLMAITKEKIVTKRLVFDKVKLDTLKSIATSSFSSDGSQIKDHAPTRVEVVSALIWKQFIEVEKRKSERKKILVAINAVNLRPRMNPSIPDHTFGNMCTVTVASSIIEGENGYKDLVGSLRVALKSINENYVKKLQDKDEYSHIVDSLIESMSKGRKKD